MKKEKNAVAGKKEPREGKLSSNKKILILLICFVAAFTVSVVFILIGVFNSDNTDEGYLTVTPERDENLPFYDSGVTLTYYFTGAPAEIKAQKSLVASAYEAVMKKTFKMFDQKNTYEDTASIGLISQNPGRDVEISMTLLEILMDANEKTKLKTGYNLFSGALNDQIRSIVSNSSPQEVDPLNDKECAQLLEKLREFYAKDDSCALYFNEAKRTVRLELSKEFSDFLKDYEFDSPTLDLGILKNAYRLKIVAEELQDKGYDNAYLSSDDGLTVTLKNAKEADYCFYSPAGDTADMSAIKRADAPSACAFLRIFSLNDAIGFYTLTMDGKTVYRHKFMTDFSNDSPVLSVLCRTKDLKKLPDCMFQALSVLSAKTAEEALARAGSFENADLLIDLNDGKKEIFYTDLTETEMLDAYTKTKI